MSPVAAWYVSNVLLGSPPPENGVAGRIAFKTGTSYGYRDAWSVGFDGKHTIGVWVGRPDGAPVPGLIGREARCADTVRRFCPLGHSRPHCRAPPAGVLMTSNAKLPPPLRRFQSAPLRRRQRAGVAAHSVPARRRAPRSVDNGRQARSDPAQDYRRGRAAHAASSTASECRRKSGERCFLRPMARVLRGSR